MIWRGFKYEYRVIDLTGVSQGNREHWLNEAGQEGWELVSGTSHWVYMSRLIVEVREAERPEPPPPAPPAKREGRKS